MKSAKVIVKKKTLQPKSAYGTSDELLKLIVSGEAATMERFDLPPEKVENKPT